MNRLRHKTRRPRGSLSAVHLRSQHFFLNMSCKQRNQRQNRQQGNRESAVFLPEHCVNTDHCTGVCKHADDTGGKQRFQRIDIPDEPRRDRSCVHFAQRICGQMRQLFAHLTAQTVGQLLSEHDQKAFPRRFQQSRQRCHAKIGKCLCNRHRISRSQPVHDVFQNQRRQKCGDDRADYGDDQCNRKQEILCADRSHRSENFSMCPWQRRFFQILTHCLIPPSIPCTGLHIPERSAAFLHAFLSSSVRFPSR